MNNKKTLSRGARVAFPLIVVATVCACAAVLVPALRGLHRLRTEIEALRAEKEAAEACLLHCQRETEELKTDAGIERIARDDLHLVRPGERVFVFEQGPGTPSERRP